MFGCILYNLLSRELPGRVGRITYWENNIDQVSSTESFRRHSKAPGNSPITGERL